MVIAFRLDVKGIDEIIKQVEKIKEQILQQADAGVLKAADIVKEDAKTRAPVGMRDPFSISPGTLRDSIVAEKVKPLVAKVRDGVRYGVFQEMGFFLTAMMISNFVRKAKAMGVLMPGMAKGPHWVKNPFLTPAVQSNIGQIRNTIEEYIKKVVK